MVEWPHANFRETRLRDAMATQNHYTRRHMWTLNTTIVFVAHVGFSEGMIFLFLQVDWRLSLNFFRARLKEHICSGKVDTISTRRPSKLRPVIIFIRLLSLNLIQSLFSSSLCHPHRPLYSVTRPSCHCPFHLHPLPTSLSPF